MEPPILPGNESRRLSVTSTTGVYGSEDRFDTRSGVSVVNPRLNLFRGDHRSEYSLGNRSVLATPVNAPFLTPPRELSGNTSPSGLVFGFSNSHGYRSQGRGLGVTEYEIARATIENEKEMTQRVLRLHKVLKFPLPPPLHNLDLRQLSPEQVEPGSVRLTMCRAQLMRETVIQHDTEITKELERSGKTGEAFAKAILQKYELDRLLKTLEQVESYYCYPLHDYPGRVLPVVVPEQSDQGSREGSDSGFDSDGNNSPTALHSDTTPYSPTNRSRSGSSQNSETGHSIDLLPEDGVLLSDIETNNQLMQNLEGQLEEKEAECQELRDELTSLNDKLTGLEEGEQDHILEKEQLVEEKEAALKEMEESLLSINERFLNLGIENDQLIREQERLKDSLSESEEAFFQYRAQSEKTEQRLEEKCFELKTSLDGVVIAKETLQKNIKVLQGQINRKSEMLEVMESKLSDQSEVMEQERRKLLILEETNEDLLYNLGVLKKNEEKSLSQLRKLKLNRDHFKKEFDAAVAQADKDKQSWLQESSEKDSSISELKTQLNEIESVNLNLKEVNEKAQVDLQVSEKEREELHVEHEQVLKELYEKITILEQEGIEKDKTIVSLEERAEDLKVKYENQIDDMAEGRDLLVSEKNTLSAEVVKLEKQISELESKGVLLKEQMDKVLDDSSERHKALTEELESTKDALKLVQEEDVSLKDKVKSLEEAETDLNQRLDDAIGEKEAVQAAVLEANEKLTRLEQENTEVTQERDLQKIEFRKVEGELNQALDRAEKMLNGTSSDYQETFNELVGMLEQKDSELEKIREDNSHLNQELLSQGEKLKGETDEYMQNLEEAKGFRESLLASQSEIKEIKDQLLASKGREEALEKHFEALQEKEKKQLEDIASAESRESEGRDKIEQLNKEFQKKQSEQENNFNDERVQLQEEVSGIEESLKELLGEKEELKQQVEDVNKALSDRISQYEEEKEEFLRKQEEYNKKEGEFESKFIEKNENIERLENSLESMKKQFESDALNHAEELITVRNELTISGENLKKAEEVLEETQRQKSKLSSDIEQLMANSKLVEEEKEALINKQEELLLELDSRAGSIDTLTGKIERLETTINNLEEGKEDSEKLSAQFAELESQIDLLKTERDRNVLKVKESAETLRKTQEKIEILEQEKQNLITGHKQLQIELEQEIDQSKEHIFRIEEEKEHAVSEMESVKHKLEEVYEELSVEERTIVELSKGADEFKEKIKSLEDQKDLLGKEKQEIARQYQDLSGALQSLEYEKGKLQSNEVGLKQQLEEVKEKNISIEKELNDKILLVVQEKKKLESEIDIKERLLNDLNDKNESLVSDNGRVYTEYQEELKKVEKLTAEAKLLRDDTKSKIKEEKKKYDILKSEKEATILMLEETKSNAFTLAGQLEGVSTQLLTKNETVKKITQELSVATQKARKLEVKCSEMSEAEEKVSKKLEEKVLLQQALEKENSELLEGQKNALRDFQAMTLYGEKKIPMVSVSSPSGLAPLASGRTTIQLENGQLPDLDQVIKGLREFTHGHSERVVPDGRRSALENALKKAGDNLDQRRRELEKQYSIYRYNADQVPSETDRRNALIKALLECKAAVEKAQQKYVLKDGPLSTSTKIGDHLQHIDRTVKQYEIEKNLFNKTANLINKDYFLPKKGSFESFGSAETPGDCVTSALLKLQSFQHSPSKSLLNTELNGYAAGIMTQSVCRALLEQSENELSTKEQPAILAHLLLYQSALRRMDPESLPLDLVEAIPHQVRLFMKQQVADAIEKLHAMVEKGRFNYPKKSETEGIEPADPRGIPGDQLARTLLDNPEFAHDVVSFLSSAKDKHYDISKPWYRYPEASEAWLRDVRIKHDLIDTPTFAELYQACLNDLKNRNVPRLLIAAVQSHEGKNSVGSGKARKDKLISQVEACVEEEQKLADTPPVRWRGQAFRDNQLAVHPHRDVLDCFKPDTERRLIDTVGVPDDKGSYKETPLGANPQALLNAFFEGAGNAVVKQSKVTEARYLQLKDSRCIPPLVFEEKGSHWQVSMANAKWTVDPCILLDHPQFVVPFESRNENIPRQQDWIPLRDHNGNTGILLLRKTAEQPQFFLYEMSSSGKLVPRPVSDTPVTELHQARFMLAAAEIDSKSASRKTGKRIANDVGALNGSQRDWVSRNCQAELQAAYELSAADKSIYAPLKTVDANEVLKHQKVGLNPLRKILKTKRDSHHKDSVTLDGYDPTLYASFSVDARFDLVGDAFLKTCQEQRIYDNDPILKGIAEDQDVFRKGVFKSLKVFKDCELNPNVARVSVDQDPESGTPDFVVRKLDHVVKVNRNHCTRLNEQLFTLRGEIVKRVSKADSEAFKGFSSRQILDQVLFEFEQGRLPEGCDNETFITLVANLVMAENDLTQTRNILSGQARLRRKLVQLSVDSPVMISKDDRVIYEQRCQRINLEMALLATKQQGVQRRLESYETKAFTTDVMALMSFERRAKTVLRPNQVEEVSGALSQLTDSMQNNTPMARVSHKGTGWGKSTILQILTDHAVKLSGDRTDCSVLVVAPETNQAELDIVLSRYYAGKNKTYRRLDLTKDYVEEGEEWWTPEVIRQIENTVLGLPRNTQVSDRSRVLAKNGRAPVGISIKDVQILMHLLRALELKTDPDESDKQAIKGLHAILDICRESPAYFDEWASVMVPGRKRDIEVISSGVSSALKALPDYQVKTDDIIRSHDQFVMSSKRRQLLCATTGTDYAAAVVAGAADPGEIKPLSNTDPFTTQQRFRHWLTKAEPVFVSAPAIGNRKEMLNQVISKVGTHCPIMVFDGTESGEKTAEKAKNFYEDLKVARDEVALNESPVPRGMLFYNQKKEMQQYLEDDYRYGAESGAAVPAEEEAVLRAEGGAGIDVYLTREQSEGTDAPQGKQSVGVYLGLFEQGKQGREDVVSQQVGRLMRASVEARDTQKLMVVVDVKDVEQSCTPSPERDQFLKVTKELESARANLLESCGNDFNALPPRQKMLIDQPLEISDHPEESKEVHQSGKLSDEAGQKKERDVQLEKRVDDEIDRLKGTEWAGSGLSEKISGSLAEFKKLEWQSKKAWLELTAVELAKRESNEDTRHYEQLLDEAQVRSHVSDTFGKEHQWLRSGGNGLCRSFEFSKVLSLEIGASREQGIIQGLFRSTTAKIMSGITRQEVPEALGKDDVPDLVTSKYAKEQIEQCADQLRANGIKQIETDPLLEVRLELYETAIMAHGIFIDRISNLQKIITKPEGDSGSTIKDVINFDKLERMKISAEKTIEIFNDVLNNENTDRKDEMDGLALDLKNEMGKRYKELLDGLVTIAFSSQTSGALRNSAIRKINECVKQFCIFPSSHTLGVETVSRDRLVEREIIDEDKGNGRGSSCSLICWRKTKGVSNIKGEVEIYDLKNILFDDVEGSMSLTPVRAKSPQLAAKKLTLPRSRSGSVSAPSGKASYGGLSKSKSSSIAKLNTTVENESPEVKFNGLIKKAKALRDEQKSDESILEFCTNTGGHVFKRCVDEWQQHMDKKCDERFSEVSKASGQAIELMKKQEAMMQKQIVQQK